MAEGLLPPVISQMESHLTYCSCSTLQNQAKCLTWFLCRNFVSSECSPKQICRLEKAEIWYEHFLDIFVGVTII